MKSLNPNILIALASCLGVVALVAKDVKRSGPGELSRVHGQVGDLVGSDSCSQCHGDASTTPDQACIACHAVIGEHIGAGKGLHGSLGSQVQKACALCHSEHHGGGAALVNTRTFLVAGIEDVLQFDHSKVGYEMGGAHLDLGCTECHGNAKKPLLDVGERRYIGLSQDCATCHEDPHGGQMQASCADCHNQISFDSFATFDHDEVLELTGAHGELTCVQCHAPDSIYSVENLSSKSHRPESRTCADCHESPHSTPFSEGIVDLDPDQQGCALCHGESDTAFSQEAPDLSALLHAASGFTLEAPHDNLKCAECHGPVGAEFADRFPGRPAERCESCHTDPHGGQFELGPQGTSDCLSCHSNLSFKPHNFDEDLHAAAGFTLDGAHNALECSACHTQPVEGAPIAFRGTASSCKQCHSDAHDGSFKLTKNQDCGTCHTTELFGDAHAQSFDHLAWTGFELGGAHAQNRCESCHEEHGTRDEFGRVFGRIAARYGEVEGCQSCHADPHGGMFTAESLPLQVNGKQGCARCHGEASFRAAADGLDHGLWMGFSLEGAHASVSCSECHTPLARPDAQGRTWGQAQGSACNDCHSNPHGNQFETSGTTDCSRCHSPADTFHELLFDHDRDSRFALDDTHAELACVQCHRQSNDSAGEPLRYKPLGMQCVDCHGETRRRLPGGRGKQ